jgi:deaminated glutathione amidase
MRFPEPLLRLRRLVLLYLSAFIVPTGKLHWDVIPRGRAVKTQCWVVAAAQRGRHDEKRVSYGGSIVVNPRGEVVRRLSSVDDVEKEGIDDEERPKEFLVVDIDLGMNQEVRKAIPLLRTNVYPEI